MLINAGLCLQLVVLGSMMKSRAIDRNASVRELLNFGVFRDARFVLLLIDGAMIGGAGFVVYAVIQDLVIGRGMTLWESATLVSIVSFSTTLSRILAAFLSSLKCMDRVALYTFTSLSGCAGVVGCVFSFDFWSFAISLFIFGFSFGIKISQLVNVVIDLVGVQAIAVAIGYFMFAIGLGGFVLPLLAGLLADQYGAEKAFLFVFVAILVGFFCCCVILMIRRKHNKRQALEEHEREADEAAVGLNVEANGHPCT